MKTKILWIVFASLYFAFAYDVRVKASVSNSQVFIGDYLTYTVEVNAPKGAHVDLPNFVGNLGSFEVKDWHTEESALAKETKTTWSATLNTFVSGDFVLLSQRVVVTLEGDSLETTTDPVPVRVSMRTSDSDVDILEAEAPMELPGTPFYVYVLIALAVIFVLILLYFAIKNWKRTKIVPVLPPYEEAVLALKELEESHLEENQAAYFMKLGIIVRRYVERRFKTAILDATPLELKARMAHVHGLPEAYKGGVVSLSEETDPVKFAKVKLSQDRVLHWTNFAKDLLEATKPVENKNGKEQ